MSEYTTGEMAKLCGVSVRTVQFYDTKGLLPPSSLTEGGRRLYSESDLSELRLILALKSFGLSLDTIMGVLRSESREKVLELLLDEQTKRLSAEIEEKQEQLSAVKDALSGIRTKSVPVESIPDVGKIMKNKKGLRKIHGAMLAVGLIMDVIQIGTIVLWALTGIWLPFAIGMPMVIALGAITVRMYYKNTAYICAECGAAFKPKLSRFIFSAHTPKARKLTCEKCGHTGYCVETMA